MIGRRSLLGVTFCTCYLASHLTNKYVLSVLKFTYPTLFQGWQTLIGGLLLHMSWKLGCVELNSSLRSNVLAWLPASVLSVGIIYAGSRALSRLAVPVFFILHNVAEVLICGYQKCVWKEKTSPTKICSALFLAAAAGCLPFQDAQNNSLALQRWSDATRMATFSRPSTVAVGSMSLSDQPWEPVIPHPSHPSFEQSITVDFPSSSAEWFSLTSWAQAVYLRRPLETHFSPSDHLIARFSFLTFPPFLPWHYQDSTNGQVLSWAPRIRTLVCFSRHWRLFRAKERETGHGNRSS
ncbi:UDP-N-acetylglucosamine transporter TMEM241 isoform X2 [Microtus pennsylvanicus]|uniref:UDP-N-acetylglucosamine transporter TMEM241 isoform X2 n=1 Tax=Microtus pennsylvanicus TaxID=10058 RepID=UPI003F6C2F83